MSEDTKLKELIINTLSPEQMPEVLSETEIYLVEDDVEYASIDELNQGLATKQDVIPDLDTIRDGASKGATALQEVPSEYVKNTDYATSSVAGVVQTGNAFGITNGALYANTLSLAQYDARSNDNVIGKGTLENIKEYLVTSVGDTKYSTLEQYNYLDGLFNTKADLNLANCTNTTTNAIDGQWVFSDLTLASQATAPKSSDVIYDLSSYLPNDGYNYEVILSCNAETGTTSGNTTRIFIYASTMSPTQGVLVTWVSTRTSSSMSSGGNTIIPIATDRKLCVRAINNNTGIYSLRLHAYRRIGTNQ